MTSIYWLLWLSDNLSILCAADTLCRRALFLATSMHNYSALHSGTRDEEPLIDAGINGGWLQIPIVGNVWELARVNSVRGVWDGSILAIMDIKKGQQKAVL